ncbi:Hypothetical_protein [Hexamita inflata]|uniref:Hypothetical_protein n=1 Tax=Hexamita inflata TaxID=28002 RepID=A0AA86N8P1_9EUKA|nr:Hypothetical protein HINF_LOCUS2500 [Hexamita inflata]
MNNLNNLVLKSTTINLSILDGTWKFVQMANCQLYKQMSKTFQTQNFKISSYDSNILNLFANYQFDRVQLQLQCQNAQTLALLKRIKWKSMDLTIDGGQIDLEQIQGHYNTFKTVQCIIINNFTAKFSCNTMVFIKLFTKTNNSHLFNQNTAVLQNLKCDVLYIYGYAVIDYLPQNIKELYIQRCKIVLRTNIFNLQILKLFYCQHKISMSQMPSLKQLLLPSSCTDKNILSLQNSILTRQNILKHKNSSQNLILVKVLELNTSVSKITQLRKSFQGTQLILNYLNIGYE